MKQLLNNPKIKKLIRLIVFFCFIGLIGGCAGFIYGLFEKPKYESRLSFALDEGGSGDNASGIAGIAAQFGFSLGSGSDEVFGGENITGILKSRRMVERVLLSVDTLDGRIFTLADRYSEIMQKKWKNKAGIINVKFPPGSAKENLSYIQDSILFCIYTEITKECLDASRPDKKLNIFEINVKSPDERFTKVFTDRILQETSKFYTELRTKKSKQTLDILEERVATLKGNLNNSLSAKAGVLDANTNPAFAAAQVPLQKEQINIQAYGGAYGELFKNLELARYQYLKEIPLLQIIDPADYPMQVIKTGKLKFAITFAILFVLLAAIIKVALKNFKNQIAD